MKIAMIGSGYVGLVSGACFTDVGHDVVCVDKDTNKIDALLACRIPIFEPALDHLVASNVASGRLRFTTNLTEGVKDADVPKLNALRGYKPKVMLAEGLGRFATWYKNFTAKN